MCEKRRKLIHIIDKSWRNGFHAYAWGCYPTSVYKGISDHLHTKTWIYSFTLHVFNRSNRNYKLLSKSNVMEISYEIQEKQELESVQMGGGCYTKCEVNVDYGADYWCCERIKSA